MITLIKNGRVLNPATKTDAKQDLYILEDRIVSRETLEKLRTGADTIEIDKIIDASNCYVMPGLIDLHVHLRDPGLTHKETIESGCQAALHGGFTTICAMPNTMPTTDNAQIIEEIIDKAKKVSPVRVIPVGAVTIGQEGNNLTDIKAMKHAGSLAISEDGKSVMDESLYRQALANAAKEQMVVMAHCEDKDLVQNGVLNLGKKSKELGMLGISNEVEDRIVRRDIALAKETNAALHLCHCSTKNSVQYIEEAKKAGVNVTAEVCPHHFVLTDEDIPCDDANYKMNPPLRTKEDVDALIDGLQKGIIDCISTDHAPHSVEEKAQSIKDAPFGIVGLETAVALTMTYLVDKGILTPLQMAEKMSYNPAKILGIDRGDISEGKIADIAIINPNESYQIDVNQFKSKGRNTPFHEKNVKGKVKYTIIAGKSYSLE